MGQPRMRSYEGKVEEEEKTLKNEKRSVSSSGVSGREKKSENY